jgi:hypothetical protein
VDYLFLVWSEVIALPQATPEQSQNVRRQTAFLAFTGICIFSAWIALEFMVYLFWPRASDTVGFLIFLPFATVWLIVLVTRFRCPVV